MKSKAEFGTRLQFGEKWLLGASVAVFVLVVAFVIVIAVPVPSVWRKIIGFLGVIGLLGSPNLLLIGMWQAVRYERSWRTIVAIAVSLIGTILAWGVTVLYAMGAFGFNLT